VIDFFQGELILDVLNDKNRFTFCRFRTSNHRLPIEVGRWTNVERHNRLCQLCLQMIQILTEV
jgi:hypothetical protein